ncbi:MAG: divergent PAP2 family protein [Candidatus Saccharimonadales bacterium]
MQLLLIAFSAWFVAQLIKFSLKALVATPDFKLFYQSGGMPSAHSATVVAVAIAALAIEGLQSPIFGIAAVLAAIVIYDSLGIRRSSGEQSVMMNVLLKTSGNTKLVKEIMGHTPVEVGAGAIAGAIVALLFTSSDWDHQLEWLVMSPPALERSAYLLFFALLFFTALAARLILQRYRRVRTTHRLKLIIWWSLVLPAAIGLFMSLLQFQTIHAGSWRLWPLMITTALGILHIVLWRRVYRFIGSHYRYEVKLLERHRATRTQVRKNKKRRRK